MNLRSLLESAPLIHEGKNGNPESWQLDTAVLAFIDRNVNSNSKTLETGAGVSTILFGIKQSHHTCIVPDSKQVRRIKDFCTTHQVSIDRLSFVVDISENALPRLVQDGCDKVKSRPYRTYWLGKSGHKCSDNRGSINVFR